MKKLILISGLGLSLLGVACKDGDDDVRTGSQNRQLEERDIRGSAREWNDEKAKDRMQDPVTEGEIKSSPTGQQVRENMGQVREGAKKLGDELDSNPNNNHWDADNNGKK